MKQKSLTGTIAGKSKIAADRGALTKGLDENVLRGSELCPPQTFQDMSSAFNLMDMSLEEATQLARMLHERLSPLISFEGHDSSSEVISTAQGESSMVNRVLSQAAHLQSINAMMSHMLQHLTV